MEDATVEQLVSLVKALQKQIPKSSKRSWFEYVKAQEKKDGIDPSKHSREVLEAYLGSVLGGATDGSGDDGASAGDGAGASGAAAAASGGAEARTSTAEFVQRFLKWAREAHKDEAKGRGSVPSQEDEAACCSGSQQQVSVWSLVRRTRAHPKYGKYYGELQAYGPGWRRVKRRPLSAAVRPRLLALDCEMCATADDPSALLGVCVVDEFGEVVYRQLVRPPGEIRDLRTALTGVTEEDMAKVTLTFKDAQRAIRKLLEAEAGDGGEGSAGRDRTVVLVGHALHHDLAALKIDHQPVIDTSLLYSFVDLPDCIPSLKDLAKQMLGLDMREERGGAHDSREDAGVSMRLVVRELQMAQATGPLPQPKVRVSAEDQAKLLAHSLPEGVTEEALRLAFAAAGAPAAVRLEGNLEDKKVLLVFAHMGSANEAFNKLPGKARRDSLGRPYKEVSLGAPGVSCKIRKMVARGDMAFGAPAKPGGKQAGAKRARSQAGSQDGAKPGAAPAAGGESVRKPKRQRREGGGGGGASAKKEKEQDPLKQAGKGRQQQQQGQRPPAAAEAAGANGGATKPAATGGDVGAPAAGANGAAAAAATPHTSKKRKTAAAAEAEPAGGQAAAGGGATAAAGAGAEAAGAAGSDLGDAKRKEKKDKSERKRKREKKEEGGGSDAEEEKAGKKGRKGADDAA